MKLGIKTFFLISSGILMLAGLSWYLHLPSQVEFLKEKRWVNDETAINRAIEMGLPSIYAIESEIWDRKAKVIEIDTIPIDDEDEFKWYLTKFARAAPKASSNYFESVENSWGIDETRHTVAVSTAKLKITEAQVEKVGPFQPPIIISQKVNNVKICLLSMFEGKEARWQIKCSAEDRGDTWVTTPQMIEKYYHRRSGGAS